MVLPVTILFKNKKWKRMLYQNGKEESLYFIINAYTTILTKKAGAILRNLL